MALHSALGEKLQELRLSTPTAAVWKAAAQDGSGVGSSCRHYREGLDVVLTEAIAELERLLWVMGEAEEEEDSDQ
jgi:hypothetical protein